MKRIGFIINSRFPEWRALSRGMRPHHLLGGWTDRSSPMHFMRFGWIGREVNRDRSSGMHYELFRPWRRYDAVIFLKSMALRCAEHAHHLQKAGTKVVFEANVDYYTESDAMLPARHLRPTPEQRHQAVTMTEGSSGVIASSSHLAGICRKLNPRTFWIPDNIPRCFLPRLENQFSRTGILLPVWWSGMADKVADLLAAGESLRLLGNRIMLHLVTGDLKSALGRLEATTARALESLLSSVPHTIHRYRSIPDLLRLYTSAGGVIISPRGLENPYNQSHTEWKITLGMAAGLPAIASPQQSYLDVLERAADPSAVTICGSSEEWREALEAAFEGSSHDLASNAARKTVEAHYLSEVVARKHRFAVDSILQSPER